MSKNKDKKNKNKVFQYVVSALLGLATVLALFCPLYTAGGVNIRGIDCLVWNTAAQANGIIAWRDLTTFIYAGMIGMLALGGVVVLLSLLKLIIRPKKCGLLTLLCVLCLVASIAYMALGNVLLLRSADSAATSLSYLPAAVSLLLFIVYCIVRGKKKKAKEEKPSIEDLFKYEVKYNVY